MYIYTYVFMHTRACLWIHVCIYMFIFTQLVYLQASKVYGYNEHQGKTQPAKVGVLITSELLKTIIGIEVGLWHSTRFQCKNCNLGVCPSFGIAHISFIVSSLADFSWPTINYNHGDGGSACVLRCSKRTKTKQKCWQRGIHRKMHKNNSESDIPVIFLPTLEGDWKHVWGTFLC